MLALQPLLPALRALCDHHHVARLWAFGSVLTDRFGPASDVDFLVEFAPDIPFDQRLDVVPRLHDNLTAVLRRPVDVLVTTNVLNPFLRAEIWQTRHLLYERPD